MTTPDTHDVEATVAEILALEEAGCEMVRVTVPKPQDAAVLGEIKKRIHIPLICDIHFDYKMALAALDHPVDKIRINPGNIGGYDRYRQVMRKAKDKGLPMRIGVNAGSLERELAMKYGFPCPPAMVDSALRYIEIAESEGYHDMIVSLKSSDVLTAVEAYRLYAKQANYPTHIGITEAGKAPYAVTKSACGLAPILLDGIGDTIRISLLGDPVPEIAAAFDILQATQRRVRKPELIACPTCGRLEIDLEGIIAQLEKRLAGRTTRDQDQRARLHRQRTRRGARSRPGHRRRQGQGRHLQARRDHPPRAGKRNGRRLDRRDRQVGRRRNGQGHAAQGEAR